MIAKRNNPGRRRGKRNNPAVSKELLEEILSWKIEGASNIDVITRLRQRTLPRGYALR